jgi:hypothetical protein
MKVKLSITVLVILSILCISSISFSEPYEFTGKVANNTGIENTRYIAVDQSRIVSNVAKAQPVTEAEKETAKSRYNIDIENWKDPEISENALAPRRDGMEFGRGFGVDMDLVRQNDAYMTGGMDARETHNILEDSRY